MAKDKDGKYWVSAIYSSNIIYNSLDTLIPMLNEAKAAQVRGEWRDLRIDKIYEYEYEVIALVGMRAENDKQRIKREAAEAVDKVRHEKYERQQYEALKKKFGGDNA